MRFNVCLQIAALPCGGELDACFFAFYHVSFTSASTLLMDLF